MNCQKCLIEIEELETDERLNDEARAHLSACTACRAFHDERQSLKRLVGSLAPVSAPTDFHFKLRARIKAAGGARRKERSSWRSFAASAPAIALAASFALLVAGFVLSRQMKSTPSTNERPSVVAASQPPDRNPEQASGTPGLTTNAPESVAPAPVTGGKDVGMPVAVVKGLPSRGVSKGKYAARHESPQAGVNDLPVASNDSAVRSAPQIVANGTAPLSAGMNPIVELPVRSASQPMRVFIDDRSGTKRAVTLEPVIFGSQDFTGRNTSLITTSQGIW
jgi:hypothetical protein